MRAWICARISEGRALHPKTVKRFVKPPVFAVLLIPFFWIAGNWLLFALGEPNALTFNPFEYTNRFLGDWALRILLLALALTPWRKVTGQTWPLLMRRMIGLFAFFYVCLHITSYVALDQQFDWDALLSDIVDRKYITAGLTAFALLLPLAITSTNKMVKRLGGRRWRCLHRLVYPAGVLGVLHFIWMAKGNQLEPWLYAGILALLLSLRFLPGPKPKRQRA